MNSHDVLVAIDQIAATPSRNDKEALIEGFIKDPMFERVLKLAYDTFITFGITPPKVKKFGEATITMDTPEVWKLLEDLRTRTLTGNAAKDAVKTMLEFLDKGSSQLLYRILAKDLRAGFGKNTVNRVLPGTIVTFDVMLSKGYEAKKIKAWPVAVEPKLDGLRAMSLCVNGTSKAFSRVGNHFPALDCLSEYVAFMVRKAWERAKALCEATPVIAGSPTSVACVYYRMLGGSAGPSLAIDAEAISGGFNKTSGDVKRKSVQAEEAVLHVFDCLPYALMTGDEPEIKIPYKVRRAFVEFVVSCAAEDAPIVHTPMEIAANDEVVLAIYQKHRDAGLEGAMIKNLAGHYHKKRHGDLMKLKGEIAEDLRITGYFEGKVGTRLEGKFAGFLVDRSGVEVAVGGGFSHEHLEELDTAHKAGETYTGRLIEVEAHEVTPDGSLRHPRFKAWRDDKDENLKVAA